MLVSNVEANAASLVIDDSDLLSNIYKLLEEVSAASAAWSQSRPVLANSLTARFC